MLTYTYIDKGKFGLVEKPKPQILHERDAIVKVTLASICSSDLHIKHGSVPRAVKGITVGHEMVGISCCIILRATSSISEGMEFISVLIRAHASSTRSMALSGRKRSEI